MTENAHPDRLAKLERLREAGVTHVVARELKLFHKSYPFLDASTFSVQFEQPEALLRERLSLEGTVLFRDGRYGVWAIDDPRLDADPGDR